MHLATKSHLHAPIPSSAFPKGFLLTGVHAGVKKDPALPDLALVLSASPRPTAAAACFTRNAFPAAPVRVSADILRATAGRARAIVVNSGCANAVTGQRGLDDAWAMVRATDALLPSHPDSAPAHQSLVMSTGLIGQPLPIARILAAIPRANPPPATGFPAWELAARAFMTTDTFPKLRARAFRLRGAEYRLAGIAKGAGMIHPDMAAAPHATLLACVLTDAPVAPRSLRAALEHAVARSFNAISVDGDMSTNDSVVALANGAGVPEGQDAREIDEQTDPKAYHVFRAELTAFAADLAQLVVRDGEGATKFVTVSVNGAPSYADAHRVASRISTSALVKTALYGEDANWGRILAATGSVSLSPGHAIDPTKVSVSFVPSDGTAALPVLVNGEPEKVDELRAKQILGLDEFEVSVDLGIGGESAKYWTCDFSYEYVRINGDYRS